MRRTEGGHETRPYTLHTAMTHRAATTHAA